MIIRGKSTDWQLSNGQFRGTDGYFPTRQFRHQAFLRPDSFSPEHFPDLTFPQAITIKPIYLTLWMKKVPYQYLLQAQLIPPIKEFAFQPLWTANWNQMLYSCTGEFLPLLADCSFWSVLNYVNMSRFQQSKIPKLNDIFKVVKESLDFRDNFANLTCCTFLLDVRLSFKERSLKYKNSYWTSFLLLHRPANNWLWQRWFSVKYIN